MPKLIRIFAMAFVIGLSGAVAPGPLLAVCAHQTLTAGFAAGMIAVAGHALAEFVLVIVMLAGLAAFLKRQPKALRAVKSVAGLVLLALGGMMLWSAPAAEFSAGGETTAASTAIPLLLGAAASVGNPYFVLWWATVGLSLLGDAARAGRVAVPLFYIGHILSDFVWFAFVCLSLALGKQTLLGPASYRVLLFAAGLFMIGFGAWFALRGEKKPDRHAAASP